MRQGEDFRLEPLFQSTSSLASLGLPSLCLLLSPLGFLLPWLKIRVYKVKDALAVSCTYLTLPICLMAFLFSFLAPLPPPRLPHLFSSFLPPSCAKLSQVLNVFIWTGLSNCNGVHRRTARISQNQYLTPTPVVLHKKTPKQIPIFLTPKNMFDIWLMLCLRSKPVFRHYLGHKIP